MEYKECVSPCAKTCQSLNINEVCHGQCVDGCSCPGNLFTGLFIKKHLAVLLPILLEEGKLCLPLNFPQIRNTSLFWDHALE